jgi:DNA-binding transcriptional regulator GbsR (MarR family)
MIEIITGTPEERIIKLLQRIYPITIFEVENKLGLSRGKIVRVLKKLQTKNILKLEPLPDKTFIRLLRNDFKFIGKKRQRKFMKNYSEKKKQEIKEYDGIMYS